MSLIPTGFTAKQARKVLERENREWPPILAEVPRERWSPSSDDPTAHKRVRVLRSRSFLVQVFQEDDGVLRMSVNRTTLAPGGQQWEDGITWDELQRLKAQAGYGTRQAVEIYPADVDIVNVANLRHLWILPNPLLCGWRWGCR